jgi:signal transduction histidine kinase
MCTTLILIAAVIIARLSLSSYARLEHQIVTGDLERLDKAIEGNVDQLVVAGRGYAYWNDTQEFIWGTYPEYPTDNGLDDNIFSEIDIDLFILADISGNIFYDRFFNDNEAHALDEATLAYLQPLLKREPSDKAEHSGFMNLPGGYAMVASLPILNNLGEGEPAGTLVVLCYLDAERLAQIAETPASFQLTTLQQSDVQDRVAELQNEAYLIEAAGNVLKGYHQLFGIGEASSLLLVTETQRTIYQQGLKNVLALIVVLGLVGVASVIAVSWFLERTILKRLSYLSKSVRSISETGDITARTTLSGKDELAFLSNEINRMLSSLEHQEEALRKSNQELEQFAYVASHDLQEPLRKVQAFSDRLASKYADKLGDDGKLYIERMQDASGRMRTLIQDLLTFSRVRSKGQEFVSVDLNEVVRGVVADLEVRLEQVGGRVEIDNLPTLLADPLQMRQVFQNLIGNALKFKKSGVPPIVRVMSRPKGDSHRIIVQDNGIGFEMQYAEKVFEIFQRLHGRSDFEGTGMGLAIVKKILERHVGSIRAESEVGKGARFIMTFPNHKTDPAQLVKKTLVDEKPNNAAVDEKPNALPVSEPGTVQALVKEMA